MPKKNKPNVNHYRCNKEHLNPGIDHLPRQNSTGLKTPLGTTSDANDARMDQDTRCYYGGGLSCVLQAFLCLPMLYVGVVHEYDCPAADFVPILCLVGGTCHLFLSLPFVGLFAHAIYRAGLNRVRSGRPLSALTPVARSAANAFFSSSVGYALDVVSLFFTAAIAAVGCYNFAVLDERSRGVLINANEGNCKAEVVYFFLCWSAIYLAFASVVLIVFVVGCARKDYWTSHTIFREVDKHSSSVGDLQMVLINFADMKDKMFHGTERMFVTFPRGNEKQEMKQILEVDGRRWIKRGSHSD